MKIRTDVKAGPLRILSMPSAAAGGLSAGAGASGTKSPLARTMLLNS